jgi:Fic family protein
MTATSAVETARRVLALFRRDAERVQTLGRGAANAMRVFDALRRRPLATIPRLVTLTGVSFPTVARAIDGSAKLGIVREITGKKRERVFAYTDYLAVLSEGTEPL